MENIMNPQKLFSRKSLFLLVLLVFLLSPEPGISRQPQNPTSLNGSPIAGVWPASLAPDLEKITPEDHDRIMAEVFANLWQYVPDFETYGLKEMQIQETQNGIIVYVGSDGYLYSMNSDGTVQTPIVTGLQNLTDPVWSPQDIYVAFVGDGANGRCLYKIHFGSKTLTTLVCGYASIVEPRWSENSSYLTFFGQETTGESLRAWVISANGGTPIELATSMLQIWSPDWIDDDTAVFAAETTTDIWHIYRVDVSQPDSPQAITPNIQCNEACPCGTGSVLAAYPHLSPDGSTLAYLGARSEGDKSSCTAYYAVYLVDPNGEMLPAKIADVANSSGTGVASAWTMRWAPDNQRVGLLAGGSDQILRLTTVDTASSSVITLHGREGGNWNRWSWAPDGTRMAVGYIPNEGLPEVDEVNPGADSFTNLAEGGAPAWSTVGNVAKPPLVLVHGWQGSPTSMNPMDCEPDDPSNAENEIVHYGFEQNPPNTQTGKGYAVDYWQDMPSWLANSYDVWIAQYTTNLLDTPSLQENAQCLKNQINYVFEETGGQPITVVAHSMGGLVSRACLTLFECKNKVAELITLGSPHAGLPAATIGYLLPGGVGCLLQPGLCQTDVSAMYWFNLANRNQRNVNYMFLGGDNPDTLGYLWLLSAGPNDGLVGKYSSVGWRWKLPFFDPFWWEDPSPPVQIWTDEVHSRAYSDLNNYYQYRVEDPDKGVRSYAYYCMIAWLNDYLPSYCEEASFLPLAKPSQVSFNLNQMTQIQSGHISTNLTDTLSIQIDTADNSLFNLSWVTGTLTLTLTRPDGQLIDPDYAATYPQEVVYQSLSGGGELPPSITYIFTDTVPGDWQLHIAAGNVGTTGSDFRAFAMLESDRTLTTGTDATLYAIGQTATITATLQSNSNPLPGGVLTATLTRPGGIVDVIPLVDQGNGNYETSYTIPDAAGFLFIRVTASGVDSGASFTRQADMLVSVAPNGAQLTGTYTDQPRDDNNDGLYEFLDILVEVDVVTASDYILSADLEANGQLIAQTAIDISLTAGTQTITLPFAGDDIRGARQNGPYTVTHLYLVPVDLGIPADSGDNVWVTAAYSWQDFGSAWRTYLPLVAR